MRAIAILTLVGLVALAFSAPVASAHDCAAHLPCHPPVECLQVYPWSRLCQGDVVGFVEAYVGPLGHLLA